ncbi:SMP-30/gluconolactonase/LRE family protein [Rhodococcus sp. CX]|uniref:SMP-30/gluconolactonase/LRE family protein n=1 Tax=Rhodococcus sp. CX TaxID=2789880 RepID=UPI001E35FDDA|nr:SMP-30/gluconolactonase/LRE family protein [Rhodococcus sp. CX]
MTSGARYTGTSTSLIEGWGLERLTPPSRLFGANGLRSGPDGRIYVAQVAGSQISAFDPVTGALETISPKGSDIVAPDDVAFDSRGDMYITEYYDGRVSIRGADGSTRLLRDDLPGANGITIHQDRLFVNECRVGGRLMELNPAGGAPKVLLDELPMPNGMEVGPDGKLYYPLLGTNDIWRIDPDGGEPERVAGDLGVPDAVKFDSDGFIVSTQVASGQVLRINPRNGDRTVLAQLNPGLDNLTFLGDRLFVSSFTGKVTEILAGGETREALSDGLTWPLDLTVGPDGTVYIADGLEALYGVAVSHSGTVVAADLGAGKVYAVASGEARVVADRLAEPIGVAFASNGTALVSEAGAGRILSITASGVDTLIDGLERPEGIVVHDGTLFIVDVDAKTLIGVDLETKAQQVIARNLPVGAPEGVTPKPLLGLPPFSGPQGPFAGIAAGPDGTLYVSADAEGSVLAIRKVR